jgi:hypothetical protein
VLFFSFGHAANTLEVWAIEHNVQNTLRWLSITWIALFLVVNYIIIRLENTQQITKLLNIIAFSLLIFPLISIGRSKLPDMQITAEDLEALTQKRGEVEALADWMPPPEHKRPDIYYIVFDGYVRDDVLTEFYSFTNKDFLDSLQQRGFYIVSESRSNYMNTNYSLNTSLNLMYMHDFPRSVFLQAKYNLRTNFVSNFLRDLNYRIVVFDSGSDDTNAQYADLFISPDTVNQQEQGGINPFEILLLRSTMGLLLLERDLTNQTSAQASDVFTQSVNAELQKRRERIEYAFSHLPDYAADEAPQFLFAHIYLPHIPFLYGPDGEPLRYHKDLNLYWYEVDPEDYPEVYTQQVKALNQMTLEMIDSVLSDSSRPVVIVLQSDHGDEIFLDYDQPNEIGAHVRSAILNAIYFSDQTYDRLYPNLTPVNTFRLIFNHWFGTDFSRLADKVYFHEHPLSTPRYEIPEFTEACSPFGICPAIE